MQAHAGPGPVVQLDQTLLADHDRRRQLDERRAAPWWFSGSHLGPLLQTIVIEPESRGRATDSMPVRQPDGHSPESQQKLFAERPLSIT